MLVHGLTKHLTLLSSCSFSATGLADTALTLISTLGWAAGIRAAPVWWSLTALSSLQRVCSAPNPTSTLAPLCIPWLLT